MMQNEGEILATDSSSQRLQQTRENLERLGASQVDIREADWTRDSSFPKDRKFDAILLDVPCTNSGVIRRRVDVRWRLQPDDFSRQAKLQGELLARVSEHLKPDGRIVYSTCSIDHEENEAVIESSGLQVEEVKRCLPWEDSYDGAFAALLRP